MVDPFACLPCLQTPLQIRSTSPPTHPHSQAVLSVVIGLAPFLNMLTYSSPPLSAPTYGLPCLATSRPNCSLSSDVQPTTKSSVRKLHVARTVRAVSKSFPDLRSHPQRPGRSTYRNGFNLKLPVRTDLPFLPSLMTICGLTGSSFRLYHSISRKVRSELLYL